MAVIFELVVNFGADKEAAGAAAELVRRAGHVGVRGVPVPLGEPYVTKLTRPSAYIEFSVHPHGIGYGGPGPKPDLDPRSLTSDEVTQIGHLLYDLLRSFSGYRAAVVGWDPESLVDVDDLEADWRAGDPPGYNGLVLADDLCDRWKLGPEWSAFEPGYRWLPYSGSKNFRLSRADADLRRSADPSPPRQPPCQCHGCQEAPQPALASNSRPKCRCSIKRHRSTLPGRIEGT